MWLQSSTSPFLRKRQSRKQEIVMGIVRGSSEPLEEGESAVAGQYYAKRTYPVRSAPLVVLLLLVLYVFSPWRSIKPSPPEGMISRQCSATSRFEKVFDFDSLKSFSLLQDFDHSEGSGSLTNVNGTISLRPGFSHQSSDLHIELSVSASSDVIIRETRIRTSKEALQLTFPARADSCTHQNKCCLDFSIDMFIRPGTELADFILDTSVGQVVVKEGIDLNVTKKTSIFIRAGGMASEAFFVSSSTLIDVHSGSVLGKYSIRDALDLRLRSGTLKARIHPISAMSKTENPSILDITTHTGTVEVEYPPVGFGHLQERPYHTSISTNAGTVRGRYLVGAKTLIKTQAGIIDADIIPYLMTDTSTLTTTSATGDQRLRVVVPERSNITAITNLASSHTTRAGALNLQYPGEWEGTLYGETKVGSIGIEGEFDDIQKGTKGFLGRWVKAQRGAGESNLHFQTDVGIAHVRID